MGALLSVVLALLLPTLALADFTGRVVKVTDGDTVHVSVNNIRVSVRLESIDAPESKQAYGNQSRQSLAELCAGKTATVVETGRDRYGRTLGYVICDGVDANAEQVHRGMAWVFKRYAGAGSALYGIEADARAAKRGLWADPQPIAPWEWRRMKNRGEVDK